MVQDAAAGRTRPASTLTVSTGRAYVQLFLTVLIWGGYFVVAKNAVDEAHPLALSLARYLIGGAILYALALRLGPFPRPTRREWSRSRSWGRARSSASTSSGSKGSATPRPRMQR